jgi:hypothetical protein
MAKLDRCALHFLDVTVRILRFILKGLPTSSRVCRLLIA